MSTPCLQVQPTQHPGQKHPVLETYQRSLQRRWHLKINKHNNQTLYITARAAVLLDGKLTDAICVDPGNDAMDDDHPRVFLQLTCCVSPEQLEYANPSCVAQASQHQRERFQSSACQCDLASYERARFEANMQRCKHNRLDHSDTPPTCHTAMIPW